MTNEVWTAFEPGELRVFVDGSVPEAAASMQRVPALVAMA
jgi:hypothetical protein